MIDFISKCRQGRGKEKSRSLFIKNDKKITISDNVRQNKREGLKYLASWKHFTPALALSLVSLPVRGQKGMNPSALCVTVPP